jgi:hypothetical protein
MVRRRLTVQEAAGALGTSVDAVRSRIRRGSLESEKGEDGRVFVWLGSDQSSDKPQAEDEGWHSRLAEPLIEELRDRVRSLEDQLREERRANEENRRLLAAALERIPAIEAPVQDTPSEAPEAPTEAREQPGRVGPQPAVGGAQEGSQRAPWWRRIFGE